MSMDKLYEKIIKSIYTDISEDSFHSYDFIEMNKEKLNKTIQSNKRFCSLFLVLFLLFAFMYLIIVFMKISNDYLYAIVSLVIPTFVIAIGSKPIVNDAIIDYNEFMSTINNQASIAEIKSVIKESEQIGITNIRTYLDRKGDFISKLDIIACNRYLSENWKKTLEHQDVNIDLMKS